MAVDLEHEANEAEFISKAFGGPPAKTPAPMRMAKVRTPKSAKPQPFKRHDDFGDKEDLDVDPELEELDAELHQTVTTVAPRHTPERAFRGRGVTPGTRQPAPASVATGERPWWATAKPGEMTKAAGEQQDRMKASREAKRLQSRIND